jgi:hypothetical protein
MNMQGLHGTFPTKNLTRRPFMMMRLGIKIRVWGENEVLHHRDNTKTMYENKRVPSVGLVIHD